MIASFPSFCVLSSRTKRLRAAASRTTYCQASVPFRTFYCVRSGWCQIMYYLWPSCVHACLRERNSGEYFSASSSSAAAAVAITLCKSWKATVSPSKWDGQKKSFVNVLCSYTYQILYYLLYMVVWGPKRKQLLKLGHHSWWMTKWSVLEQLCMISIHGTFPPFLLTQ